jgi:hypothetical protein
MAKIHLLAALVLPAAALAQGSGNFCIVRTPSLQGSYTGDCVAGYASGRGRAVGTDRYEGSFLNGQPMGQGVYTFADGRRFEGEFVDGKVSGRARFYYTNGDVLEGEFRDNLLSGAGRMLRPNGEAVAVMMVNGGLVPLQQQAPVAAAAPAAGAYAPAAPAPQPMAGGAPEPQMCRDRLRLRVHSLQPQAQGRIEVAVSYENLSNVDLRMNARYAGRNDTVTTLIDNNGETWRLVAPHHSYSWLPLNKVFLPGVATRATYVFQGPNSGQEAASFIFTNPVFYEAAHGSGGDGNCFFQVRGVRPFSGS